jgi:putative ABC transport system permease protein
MSFFLILSAVALTAMLFRFNVEQRNHESGLLAALGIPAKKSFAGDSSKAWSS